MAAVASFSTSYDMEDSFQVISTQAKVRSLKRVVDTSAAYEEDSWKEMIGQDQEQRESPSVRSLSPDGDLPEKLKRKERRPRSVALNMLDYGDGLRMGENPKILSLLARHGESTVHFSANIAKVNRQNKIQERLIIITDGALYNLHMKSLKLKRRIAIGNISHISTSTLRDNFFIIHVPTEYDYVYLSEYKMEIMTLLQKLQQVATGMEMSLHVDNILTFQTDKDQVRRLEFINAPDGVLVQVYGKKMR
jgi:hypothetical protein